MVASTAPRCVFVAASGGLLDLPALQARRADRGAAHAAFAGHTDLLKVGQEPALGLDGSGSRNC